MADDHSTTGTDAPARSRPQAEVAIDAAMIRGVLRDQHADLAHLPLVDAGEGWDNKLFRLGDRYAVRVPRRAAAAALIEHEQRWLPELSRALPLPIPVAHRIGRPGGGIPWPWSITSWFDGQTALTSSPRDAAATAGTLGAFIRALHQPAPESAPRNPWRGVPLGARTHLLQEHLQQVGTLVDHVAVARLWEELMAAPAWQGPPLWIHGDLHPGNLLVNHGELRAVIDFGDLTAGDPATDLAIAWMLFPSSMRGGFFAAARGAFDAIDDDMVTRARAWALALGLAYLANSRDDPAFRALGLTTLDAVLNDREAIGQ
ncbi:MAG TPA: aminoglycoside phosphotransferase family protein [Vicinamibacterales bacterium]|nr:aminoglycoside phosphotransferase family protein [Vicinamibacterales bacterium]